jgi:hypothetical protein
VGIFPLTFQDQAYSGTWWQKIDFPINVLAAAMSGHGKQASG